MRFHVTKLEQYLFEFRLRRSNSNGSISFVNSCDRSSLYREQVNCARTVYIARTSVMKDRSFPWLAILFWFGFSVLTGIVLCLHEILPLGWWMWVLLSPIVLVGIILFELIGTETMRYFDERQGCLGTVLAGGVFVLGSMTGYVLCNWLHNWIAR